MAAGPSGAGGSLWSRRDLLPLQPLQLSSTAPAQELSLRTDPRQVEAPGRESLRLPPASGPGPQLQAEPSSILQHVAARWALGECALLLCPLLCPQTGRMELHLPVMSAAALGRGGQRAPLPQGSLLGSFLGVRALPGEITECPWGGWSQSALEICYLGMISGTE